MEFSASIFERQLPIFYAETFPVFLKKVYQNWSQEKDVGVLVVANQLYYETYYEHFLPWEETFTNFSWYICPNSDHCNTFTEWEHCLDFIANHELLDQTYLLAIGNSGVYQLSGFLQQNLIQIKKNLTATHDLQVIETAFNGKINLLYRSQPLLQTHFLSDELFYDSSVYLEYKKSEKLLEFCCLVRAGLSLKYEFLRELFKTFPESFSLEKKAFSPFLSSYLHLLNQSFVLESCFGKSCTQGLEELAESVYLEKQDKVMIGLCLHLLLSQQRFAFSFERKNFYRWLINLGYQLELPEILLSTDLAEEICFYSEKKESEIFLEQVGKLKAGETFQLAELLEGIELFRTEISDILAVGG